MVIIKVYSQLFSASTFNNVTSILYEEIVMHKTSEPDDGGGTYILPFYKRHTHNQGIESNLVSVPIGGTWRLPNIQPSVV